MTGRFGRNTRIRSRGRIATLLRKGTRVSDVLLRLCCAPAGANGGARRCGVLVSLKHGNAVQRNRIKRLCREAFRLTRDDLPAGYDYLICPHPGAELDLEGLCESLRKLSKDIVRKSGGRS